MARHPSGSAVGRLLDFFLLSGRLKTEPRKGWVEKLRVREPESVADHSYRAALMAMVYADLKGLDTSRALKMAILHDLPEAIVGDATPHEVRRKNRLTEENVAMERLLESLPDRLRFRYRDLWLEFVKETSPEARLVGQLDKLEMALQAKEYVTEKYSKKTAEEFVESARAKIKDPDLQRLLKEACG